MTKDIPVQLIVLFDIYGNLLSDRQREFFEYYYCEDLSLAEIAENAGITRQGVLDNLKRASSRLYSLEESLHIYSRTLLTNERLQQISAISHSVAEGNKNAEMAAVEIDNIINEINEKL